MGLLDKFEEIIEEDLTRIRAEEEKQRQFKDHIASVAKCVAESRKALTAHAEKLKQAPRHQRQLHAQLSKESSNQPYEKLDVHRLWRGETGEVPHAVRSYKDGTQLETLAQALKGMKGLFEDDTKEQSTRSSTAEPDPQNHSSASTATSLSFDVHELGATTGTITGLPSLTIPAQPGEYVDAVVSTFRDEQQLELHLISAKYWVEWIPRELAVTQTLAKLNNPRKGDLAVTRIGPQKVWYRAVVLSRETDAEMQILLVDFGTSELVGAAELFDMPVTVRHIPPLSFPLVVPQPMLIGVREEDMRTTLKHARISFRLGSTTDGVVFNGEDLRLFHKDSGELMPVNEAIHCAGQLERVEYSINCQADSARYFDYA
ncbi:unnamed protein product, partial [Mesorhabditis spiculigera]